MTKVESVRVGCVAVIAAVGALGYVLPSFAASSGQQVATPPDITLQPLGRAQGFGMEALLTEVPRDQIAFADAKGMTLYSYDKDSPGISRCTAACEKAWPPALAPRGARPAGDWSLFNRGHGIRQWEYQGKPLYTFVRDTQIGSVFGAAPGDFRQRQAAQRRAGGKPRPPPAGWHPALVFPVSGSVMPDQIAIREVEDARGLAFVNRDGMTLYTYVGRGGARALAALADQTEWQPLLAPDLAHAVGQWSIVARRDGVRQWALRGKPLFTFAGDRTPGDANGVGLSKDWDAALAATFYLPPDVRFEQTLDRGKVLATAQGLTLYRRDGVALDTGGGQSLRHGVPIRPGIGRNVGIKGCEAACLQIWHPFVAPANAQPDGFWDITVRPDGTRQWVYQGYALYTFSGDKKAGDMNGNDIFNMVLTDSPNQVNNVGTPMHGTAGLYWTIAYP